MARPNVFGLVFKIDDSDQKKFKKIGSQVTALSSKMDKELGSSFLNLKNVATGFFTVMATSTIANKINEFAAIGDRVAKTSATLGLSVESLQELEYVAGQQGSNVEQLNSAYQTMSTNLGKLQVGQGKLGKYLQKSNPELLKQVKGAKNSEEAFTLLTDAISKETNESTRAALATAAFGGAAQDMIKFSKGGRETIDQLREAKRKYGLISADAAKASEAFGDAQDDLKQATAGVLYVALLPLLPKLTELIKKTTEWVTANKDIIASRIDTFFTVFNAVVSTAVDLWDSGLIPAILLGVTVYKSLRATIMASQAAWAAYLVLSKAATGSTLLMVKAWLAANAAFLASPIGLIVIGLAALVAVGYLVYKNWDYLVQKAKDLWSYMMELYNGSELLQYALKGLAAVALLALSPILIPIAAIVAGIYGIYKAYQYVKSKISGEPIDMKINGMDMPGLTGENIGGNYNPLQSSNQGVIQSNINTTNKQQLDVNFNNLPLGTSVNKKGSAPNINVNTGVGASR